MCKVRKKCHVVLFCRFWDFDRDENYTVDVTRVSQVTSGEAVACIHADADRGTVQRAATCGLTAVKHFTWVHEKAKYDAA